VGTGLLAFLITVLTIRICAPYAVALQQRWRAKQTYMNGHRLVFLGGGMQLFGLWTKVVPADDRHFGHLLVVGVPRVQKGVVENTDFDPTWSPAPTYEVGRQA
jgi:hypothetical protein